MIGAQRTISMHEVNLFSKNKKRGFPITRYNDKPIMRISIKER